MIMGARTMIAPAISKVQSVLYSPLKEASRTGRGIISSELATIRGHMKFFHCPMNVKVTSVARAGLDSGRMIR